MTIAWAGRCKDITDDVRFYLQEENWKDTISDEYILRLINRCLIEEIEFDGTVRDDTTINLVLDQEAYDYPADYVSLIAASWAEDNLPITCFSDQRQFESAKYYLETGDRTYLILLRPADFLVWPIPSASAAAAITWVYNKQVSAVTGYSDLKATITYFNRTLANTGIFKTAVAGADVTVGAGQTNANVVVGAIASINGTGYEITAIDAVDHKTVTLDGDPSSGTVSEIVSDRSSPPTLRTFDAVYTFYCLKEIFARKAGKKGWDTLVQLYTGKFHKELNKLRGNNQVGTVAGWYRL